MSFPFFKQLDAMDCGPSCLRMIAKYYGKNFSVQQLREKSHILRTGVNLLGLSEAAESIGFRTTSVRTTIEKLKEQSKLPFIIHWNQEHFVVLYKIKRKKDKWFFYVADSAYGLLKYEEQEFRNCWMTTVQGGIEKGVAMMLETTPQFYETDPVKYESISLWFLLKYVRPYKKMVTQLIIGLFLGSLFFDSKLAGDLIRRIEDHKRIETFLTQSVLSVLFSGITIIVFSIVLAVYNLRIIEQFVLFIQQEQDARLSLETTTIVGLSGSGKTTLIKRLLDFYPPTEGEVLLGENSLQYVNFKEWRKHYGVVMQEKYIFNDTKANNIAQGDDMVDKNRLLYAVQMANIKVY